MRISRFLPRARRGTPLKKVPCIPEAFQTSITFLRNNFISLLSGVEIKRTRRSSRRVKIPKLDKSNSYSFVGGKIDGNNFSWPNGFEAEKFVWKFRTEKVESDDTRTRPKKKKLWKFRNEPKSGFPNS